MNRTEDRVLSLEPIGFEQCRRLIRTASIHHDQFIESERSGVGQCDDDSPFFVQSGNDDANLHRHDTSTGLSGLFGLSGPSSLSDFRC